MLCWQPIGYWTTLRYLCYWIDSNAVKWILFIVVWRKPTTQPPSPSVNGIINVFCLIFVVFCTCVSYAVCDRHFSCDFSHKQHGRLQRLIHVWKDISLYMVCDACKKYTQSLLLLNLTLNIYFRLGWIHAGKIAGSAESKLT